MKKLPRFATLRGLPAPDKSADTGLLFNYEMTPYAPLQPVGGKYQSSALLFMSASGGKQGFFRELVRLLQAGTGPDRTVFGVKNRGGKLFWEIYFYIFGPAQGGPRRKRAPHPALSIANVRKVLNPLIKINPRLPALAVPGRFMWSFEIDDKVIKNRCVDQLHFYSGTSYHRRRLGQSYLASAYGIVKENEYLFYKPRREANHILRSVKKMLAKSGSRISPGRIFIPELAPCDSFCFARKRINGVLPDFPNGVYFSGIPLKAFLFFLRRFSFPKKLTDFACSHKDDLDHMLYDVGFDYRLGKGVSTVKSSFFGVF